MVRQAGGSGEFGGVNKLDCGAFGLLEGLGQVHGDLFHVGIPPFEFSWIGGWHDQGMGDKIHITGHQKFRFASNDIENPFKAVAQIALLCLDVSQFGGGALVASPRFPGYFCPCIGQFGFVEIVSAANK